MRSELIYYLIAPLDWYDDGIRFRRHRIVEGLLENNSVKKIYWVYPQNNSKSIETYQIQDNLISIGVPENYSSSLWSSNLELLSAINDEPYEANKVLWYTHPSFPCLLKLDWEKVIYDCSDNWDEPWETKNALSITMLKKKLRSYLLRKAESKISNSSDVLFCTSNYLKNKLENNYGVKNVIHIENGVDLSFFNAVPGKELAHIPSPKIGFVGAMKNKINFKLISRIASANPSYNIILIGPYKNLEDNLFNELIKLNNVHYFESVPSNEVPKFMSQLDIGLLPYKHIEYNKAVSPLKLYEYLAVGIPVVGLGVPETKRLQEDGVYKYVEDEKLFFDAIVEIYNEATDKGLIERRINLASKNEWPLKIDLMIKKTQEQL
ncbi:LOW QUALITY PROTEIN: glycosyltransferase, family 2 [Bacillus sp. JCM 19045]|nr:LOW QUALITY PROTEIN: glycosyltransferase, family 2 [Bacillus sp. JCM 19045]